MHSVFLFFDKVNLIFWCITNVLEFINVEKTRSWELLQQKRFCAQNLFYWCRSETKNKKLRSWELLQHFCGCRSLTKKKLRRSYNRKGFVPFWNNADPVVPPVVFIFFTHNWKQSGSGLNLVFAADISRVWGCWLEKCHQMHIFTLHVCKISTLSLNMEAV